MKDIILRSLKVIRFVAVAVIILIAGSCMSNAAGQEEEVVPLKKSDVLQMFQQRILMQAHISDLEREIELRDREIEKLKVKLGCA